jgi:putative heme transporter
VTAGDRDSPMTSAAGPGGPEEVAVPPVLEPTKSPPIQKLVRITLSLLLIYLIFGVLIPSFASYQDVWDALTSLEPAALLLLTALTLLVESCKAGSYAVLVPGLGFGRAFLAQEAAAVVSNTVPGPSGTAARYGIYRKYGISAEDFGQSYVVNSAWGNAVPMVLPTVGLALLSLQEDIPGSVLTLALIGLAVTVVGVVLAVLVVRSERFAYGLGEWFGRILNWARGLVRRPAAEEVGAAVVRFRYDVLDTVRSHWVALTSLMLLREIATYLVLLTSLRALGAERVDLTAIEVFAVYTVVRLATLIEITPGNVGISEALYISALTWASDGEDSSAIVAAVFVFRLFTYVGPILVGGVCSAILGRRFRAEKAAASPEAGG